MDDAIRSIPSIRGPLSISHNRRDNRRRGKDFEKALGEESENPEMQLDEDVELRNPLKRRLPPGRKDDQGGRHIDVLA